MEIEKSRQFSDLIILGNHYIAEEFFMPCLLHVTKYNARSLVCILRKTIALGWNLYQVIHITGLPPTYFIWNQKILLGKDITSFIFL